MSTHYCPVCLEEMKPLFTGLYCPNDCDRPRSASQSIKDIVERSFLHPQYGRLAFKQSWLWQPTGYKNSRVLCCPLCLIDGKKDVRLTCGREKDGWFNATCQGQDCHKVAIENDENH